MLNSTFLINDSVTNNGKTDYIIHNKTSDGVTFFEIRNTSTHQFILPHVINSKRENIGIFDQSLYLQMDYDAQMTLTINEGYVLSDGSVKWGKLVCSQNIPAGEKIILITPYESKTLADSDTKKTTIYVEELKNPVPFFVLQLKATTNPTSGNVEICRTVRY